MKYDLLVISAECSPSRSSNGVFDEGHRGYDIASPRRVLISGQKRGVFGAIEQRELDVARQSSP